MRTTIILVVLALAGLALVAGSGTAAAEAGDAGTASIDAPIPSEDDDCLVQGCGCPDPRICSMAGVDLTVDADGFDSHAPTTDAGVATVEDETDIGYCPPEDHPCDCPDPRICSANRLDPVAL